MANGKIIKQKYNYLDFLKQLSKYIQQNNNNDTSINKLLNTYNISKREVFKRLISYNYHSPYIIYYINKYLNHKFDFYNFNDIDLIHSIKFIMKQNNIQKFYFLKSSESKDTNKPIIKQLLKSYFETIKNSYINDLELNTLYELHKHDIEYFESLNLLLNGDKKLNLQYTIPTNTSELLDQNKIKDKIDAQIATPLAKPIVEYVSKFISQKLNNKNCLKCPLFSYKMIPIDTNMDQPGNIDIMFILLNPGYDEGLYNKLLVGKSGNLFRSYLVQFDPSIKYVITNVIMCNTRNQAEIGKTDKQIKTVINKCNPYLKQLIKDFPSKIYIPIGKQAMETFNISGSITQNSGKVLNQNIIPLIHPAAVLQNESNRAIFDKSFETINIVAHKIAQSKKSLNFGVEPKAKKDILSKIPKVNDPSVKYNILSEHIINNVDSTLTYLDSVTLDYDNIVHIYLDKSGAKKYLFDKIKLPIYIKNSQFNDRNLLTSNVDSVFYINKNQKYNLTRTLNDNLIKLTQHCLN